MHQAKTPKGFHKDRVVELASGFQSRSQDTPLLGRGFDLEFGGEAWGFDLLHWALDGTGWALHFGWRSALGLAKPVRLDLRGSDS